MKILIVEDNKDLAANLGEFLELHRHVIDFAADGITGLHLAITESYDVIVLDIMLPGISGIEVCRQLRETAKKPTPILMLTAKDTIEDKVEGFDCGADDYVVKPFSLIEIHARLLALYRRANQAVVRETIQVGDLKLNLGTMTVSRGEQTIKLTPVEIRILEILMRNSPNLVSRSTLESEIWGDLPPDSDSLRTHIHGLRSAIDKNHPNKLLQTVRGLGFKLTSSHAS